MVWVKAGVLWCELLLRDLLFTSYVPDLYRILDTLATAMVAHTIYTYLVFMLGDPNPVFVIPWFVLCIRVRYMTLNSHLLPFKELCR